MESSLENKIVLITGGAKRVGAAICCLLHAHGANLMIHYRNSVNEARALQSELNLKRANSVAIIQGDLLNLATLPNLVEETVKHFGKLD
ncbi:MAG: SDR family NAD(P)-dependent oxidoreductase, partial [Methylophilaceae bacterium]|nr:SDR family NAD(P)-dependent oxidoreductase [Methylophilaceae bacterium]